MPFQVYQSMLFGKIISQDRKQPGPKKLYELTEMPLHNNKKESE